MVGGTGDRDPDPPLSTYQKDVTILSVRSIECDCSI